MWDLDTIIRMNAEVPRREAARGAKTPGSPVPRPTPPVAKKGEDQPPPSKG